MKTYMCIQIIVVIMLRVDTKWIEHVAAKHMRRRSCWGCSSWAVSFSIIIAALTGLEMTACETVFQSRYFHPVRFTSLIRWKHLMSGFRLGLPFLLSSFLFPFSLEGGRKRIGMELVEVEQCCEASFQWILDLTTCWGREEDIRNSVSSQPPSLVPVCLRVWRSLAGCSRAR